MNNKYRPERNLDFYKNKQKHNNLYFTSIVIGVCIAINIYVFNFDSLSETMLVRLTVLWLFPIVFGYYGLVAQWLQLNYRRLHFRKPKDLLRSVSKKFPILLIRPIFNIVHFPLYIPNKSPLYLAISGSLIWSVWLLIFFEVIFPAL